MSPHAPLRATPLRDATIVVVGVGGLGTPCAWALADVGVGRLVLVDFDQVEPSNLPRQILFSMTDVGRSKAQAAAARLARPGLGLVPVVARFGERNGPALLEGAHAVVDATDGASSKDAVNAIAVAAGVPLVHAAALGSEGRLLDVPPGGKPCLACLFGRLAGDDEGDTCARFGVHPGVTGTVGALAAFAALERVTDPARAARGLRVLDLSVPRVATLRTVADPACPVCGSSPARESASPREATATAETPRCAPAGVLDLRTESCPMNLLRARRAVEALDPRSSLEIWLGEEGAATVPDGLAAQGHEVAERMPWAEGLALRVRRRGSTPSASFAESEAWLRRYARQIVLPEVGEEGQRRFGRARVVLEGEPESMLACALHLAAAGVGALDLADAGVVSAARAGAWPFPAGSAGRSRAQVLAEVLAAHTGATVQGVRATTDASERAELAATIEGVGARLSWPVPSALPLARAQGALVADAVLRRILVDEEAAKITIRPDGSM